MIERYSRLTSVSLIALIALCIAWELWLAPLRPGGSLLVLKTLPLLIPLFGILRGKRYTYQWMSMFSMFYLTEGLVRAASDIGTSRILAATEAALAIMLFIGCLGYSYYSAPSRINTLAIKAED